jgi:hypothetical protein
VPSRFKGRELKSTQVKPPEKEISGPAANIRPHGASKLPPTNGTLDPGLADAITHPTLPYVDMDFGMGRNGYPAIDMTQHAAIIPLVSNRCDTIASPRV